MASTPANPTANRQAQMFPDLSADEIARLERFAERRSYADGDRLFAAGEPGPGLYVVLSGLVHITRRDGLGHVEPVIDQGAGQFLAEVGQLSGRPALVDGHAHGPVEVLLLAPERLRAALVAEADLGEKIVRALILRRTNLISTGGSGPVIIGAATDADVARLDGFLTRNGVPHALFDPATDHDAADLVHRYAPGGDGLPLAVCADGTVLKNPTEAELAPLAGLGALASLDGRGFDVVIVGAGPAGLSTAVYATSEGLSVLMLDARSFGGQAGASARIENYFGFPTGISGQALTARAFVQAQKFGAEMAIPLSAERLHCQGGLAIGLAGGGMVNARAVVIASGARYRRLDIADPARFDGRGVSYWASPIEARQVAGADVLLVGGGNSAGQAAVFLSAHARHVRVLVRRPLADTMSRYLIDRIAAAPNIEVLTGASVTGLDGGPDLDRVRWRGPDGDHDDPCRHLFLFIGAEPATEWLGDCGVHLDKGFVCTGRAGHGSLETDVPGLFAVGDARAGSVKRVGAAIGEGAGVVAQIHAHLAAH